MTKKQGAAFWLLLILLASCLACAGAQEVVRDLSVSEIRTTSAVTRWNCTYKDDQQYTLTYHIDGVARETTRVTSELMYRIKDLTPATPYVLTVSAENGGTATVTFTTPYAIDYTKYGYQLLDTGLYKSTAGKKDYGELASLSSQTLPGEVYDYDFHFMLQFQLDETDGNKGMDFLLVLRLPNGDNYPISDEFWYREDGATVTEYVCLTDTLKDIMADYGGFPAGEYVLTAYFKGEFAAELAVAME